MKHIEVNALISKIDETTCTIDDMDAVVNAFLTALDELGMEMFSVNSLEPDEIPWWYFLRIGPLDFFREVWWLIRWKIWRLYK